MLKLCGMSGMSMTIDKKQVRRAFSRHGGGGDLTAEIADRLAARLDEIDMSPEWIVDVGGDGKTMRGRFPEAHVAAADFALPRLRPQNRVFRTLADAEHLPFTDSSTDVIWSNLCFDWTDLKKSLAEAARVLRPREGLLIFSMLGRDTLREARSIFPPDSMHEFMDMHDIGDMLAQGGFSEPVLETEHITLTYTDAYAAMREIHEAGCGCALSSRARGLTGKHAWQKAMTEYAEQFADNDGRVPATYEIIYANCWCGDGGEKVVRLVPRGAPG